MTIQQVIDLLQEEKKNQLPGRFHCRAIMVRDIAQYITLLGELKKINDIRMVSLEELFSDADVMPNYENLTNTKYENEWLILPGVSEYLRLFHSSEESAQRFGYLWHFQNNSISKGRIIIPLWGCEALWFDKALHLTDDLRQEEYYFDCCDSGSTTQKLSVQVLSGDFEKYLFQLETTKGAVFCGIKEWYGFWYDPQSNITDYLILTKRFRSVKSVDADISIHVIKDTLSFIRENLVNGLVLNIHNCPKEAQDCLFPYSLSGKTVDEAILSSLNLYDVHAVDVMGKWINMTTGQKQLVFLWYAMHYDDSYLSHCISLSSTIDELPKHILKAIFPVRIAHPEWVKESQLLISAIPLQRTDEYYEELDNIPSKEDRLDYLSADSIQDRKYILHMVGQWLREDISGALDNERLKSLYPALSAYLEDNYPDEELQNYIQRYKTYKLSNTLPSDQDIHFMGVETDIYDFRYPVLSENADDNTVVLWIDALGIEWMTLLKWAIETSCAGKVESIKVTQAQLPSETRYNEQWKSMVLPYQKLDRLDKLAHRGVIDDKDYYACIEEEFRFITEVGAKVDKLLKQYPRVLITGDHGTSRLAARYFHKIKGISAPAKSEVGSHGRFCKVDGHTQALNTQKVVNDSDGNKYLVFTNYDHYTKSGFAAGSDDDNPVYGEIHGGATPEEMLVPVITVNSLYEIPLTAKWSMTNNTVKISNKRAKCRISFSKPVSSVLAKMEDIDGECTSTITPSKDWTITFSGMKLNKEKEFNVSVIADGVIVNTEKIIVKPALGGGDPF